jgi:hypothetical protein
VLHATATVSPVGYDPSTNIPFTHVPIGTLDIYVEDLKAPGAIKANPNLTTGDGSGVTGFQVGTLVASFSNFAGTGNIHVASDDGNDDAFFSVVSHVVNAILDSGGGDLLGLPNLFLKSDDTYDYSSGAGPFGLGPPTSWTYGPSAAGSITDFYTSVSGKAQFFQTPEAASVLVWSLLGLCAFGLAKFGRKR